MRAQLIVNQASGANEESVERFSVATLLDLAGPCRLFGRGIFKTNARVGRVPARIIQHPPGADTRCVSNQESKRNCFRSVWFSVFSPKYSLQQISALSTMHLALFLTLVSASTAMAASGTGRTVVNKRVKQFQNKLPTTVLDPSSFATTEAPLQHPRLNVRDQSTSNAEPQQKAPKVSGTVLCESCAVREQAKLARIEGIKQDLLQKLGFAVAPNVSLDGHLPSISPHLHNIFDKWGFRSDGVLNDSSQDKFEASSRAEDEIFSAQTERVYAFATKSPTLLNPNGAFFRFSTSTSNNNVESAQLHLHIRKPKGEIGETSTYLKIKLFSIDDVDGTVTEVGQRTFKKNLRVSSGHWYHMDVTKLVARWFQEPKTNFGLVVEAMYKGENLVVLPRDDDQVNSAKYTMYLEIVTSVPKAKVKRETAKLECEERDNDTRCCRYPLVVDFESFGWDWVIAPKKYRANYCSGQCPYRHLQRYLHTHLVSQAHPTGTAGPCCYPTQMSPILMVYFNENKEVLVSKVPGMIVTRCGCA